MYIKPLTFVYIQPIHNNFAQLFVSKNEGDLHWTIWNLTPPNWPAARHYLEPARMAHLEFIQ